MSCVTRRGIGRPAVNVARFSSINTRPSHRRRVAQCYGSCGEKGYHRLVDNLRLGGQARPATEVAPDRAKSAFADSLRGSTGMAYFSFSVVARRAVDTALKKRITVWSIIPTGGWTQPATEVAPDSAKSAFADSPRGSTVMACFSSSVVPRRGVDTAVKCKRAAEKVATSGDT